VPLKLMKAVTCVFVQVTPDQSAPVFQNGINMDITDPKISTDGRWCKCCPSNYASDRQCNMCIIFYSWSWRKWKQ